MERIIVKRRTYKKAVAILTGLAMMWTVFMPTMASAVQDSTVTVTLPEFNVTFNGVAVDNANRQYPLIVYKDITYFPMTYYDSRFLGLESNWSEAGGLVIDKTNVAGAYRSYSGGSKNSNSYRASIPTFAITINSKSVNNSGQKHPLLSFRDITYFPLTWEFGVNYFGWDYRFDGKNGLVIQSDNIKVSQVSLPAKRGIDFDGQINSQVAVANGYAYYLGEKGMIRQMSLRNPGQVKDVYQLPIWTYGEGDTYVWFSLQAEEDGAVHLYYHQGGATMGNDYEFLFHDDGTYSEVNSNRTMIKTFGNKTFSWWIGPAPGPNNLSMKVGDGELKTIGDSKYIYGWAWASDGSSQGGSGSDCAAMFGDDLYILGYEYDNPDALCGIYKINTETGKTTRVSGERLELTEFVQDGNNLYYTDGKVIYRYSIDSSKEEKAFTLQGNKEIPFFPNSLRRAFLVFNGQIYYSRGPEGELSQNNNAEALNPGAVMESLELSGDQEPYLVCRFTESPTSKYRMMIFNKEGSLVFKTSDTSSVNSVSIENSILYYYNLSTKTICTAKLT